MSNTPVIQGIDEEAAETGMAVAAVDADLLAVIVTAAVTVATEDEAADVEAILRDGKPTIDSSSRICRQERLGR